MRKACWINILTTNLTNYVQINQPSIFNHVLDLMYLACGYRFFSHEQGNEWGWYLASGDTVWFWYRAHEVQVHSRRTRFHEKSSTKLNLKFRIFLKLNMITELIIILWKEVQYLFDHAILYLLIILIIIIKL